VPELDRVGEVDGSGVGANIDGFDGMGGGHADERRACDRQNRADSFGAETFCAQACGTQKCQEATSEAGSRRRSRHDNHRSPE